MRRRRLLLAVVSAAVSAGAAVLAGLMLFGGDTGDHPTNGLAGRRADEVVRAAVDALAHAPGVRAKGTKVDMGRPVAFDTRYGGDSSDALLYLSGGTARFRRVGGETFELIDAGAFASLGYPDIEVIPGRWLLLPPPLTDQLTGPDELTLDWWTDSIDTPTLRDGTVRLSQLNRRDVVEVRGTDGSRLFVSADGPAYPLRLERADDSRIFVDFSDYGTVTPVEKPPDALDISQFLPMHGPASPGTASPSPLPLLSPKVPQPTPTVPSAVPLSPVPPASGPGGNGVEGR